MTLERSQPGNGHLHQSNRRQAKTQAKKSPFCKETWRRPANRRSRAQQVNEFQIQDHVLDSEDRGQPKWRLEWWTDAQIRTRSRSLRLPARPRRFIRFIVEARGRKGANLERALKLMALLPVCSRSGKHQQDATSEHLCLMLNHDTTAGRQHFARLGSSGRSKTSPTFLSDVESDRPPQRMSKGPHNQGSVIGNAHAALRRAQWLPAKGRRRAPSIRITTQPTGRHGNTQPQPEWLGCWGGATCSGGIVSSQKR